LRLQADLQLWQVTVESPLRSHGERPIMGLEGLYGQHRADFSPGKDANPSRGAYYMVMMVAAA